MKRNNIAKFSLTFLALAGIATSGALGEMLPDSGLQGKKILFIAGEPDEKHQSDDELVKNHLKAMGFSITGAAESELASKADGADLVIISSTADPHLLKDTYRSVPVPIFTWNQPAYPALAMTGPDLHTDFEVVEPGHFYARSFSELYAYAANTTCEIARAVDLKPQLFGTFYLQPGTVGWGVPTQAATVVANFEGYPRRAGLFTYEKGATMVGGMPAPARRVGFFMSSGNFHLLSAAFGPARQDPDLNDWYKGLELFDASVRWAVSPPPAPPKDDPAALRSALTSAAKGKKLLFVGRKKTPEGAEADAHMIDRLKESGFDVTFRDQTDPQAGADQYDLIVLSATNSKYKLSNKYRDATVPILCLEGLFADTLRMAGRNRYVDYGEHGEEKESDDPADNSLRIINPNNEMSAGLSGVVQFIKEKDVLKWAKPGPGATIVATLPDMMEQAAIFGYDKGSTMDGYYVAPARRVLFPLDNPAFDNLTPKGLALFDAAVLWSISKAGS
ncbi:MAG: hypothetical protein JOZ62_09635 [Acidobacteriaceae bacterium]|nr:hypothetical protein [Acidobacteriaceae bacterium]